MNKKYSFIIQFFIFFLLSLEFFAFGEDSVQARFNGQTKLTYDVLFNGVFTGTIQWQYLGQETVDGHIVDVLFLDSNTQILQLLNLESKEKVSLDSETHLPVKVERNVVFFGRKELIEEIYNQDEGYVKIIRNNSEAKNDLLYQEKPIHNILSLLYFFPKDIDLVKGKEFFFNLPTQKLKIKVVSEKTISINKTKKRVYFLIGSGAKRFNLWLDKRERIPLRLEFIVAVGKISLVKKDQSPIRLRLRVIRR